MLYFLQFDLPDFNFSLPSFEFYNAEAGIGLMLDIEENIDIGVFILKFSFPEKWHPLVETYNRSVK